MSLTATNNIQATLVMESHGIAPAVRGPTFKSVWSKLYQAGGYYIDMSHKPQKDTALIQGQILPTDGAALSTNGMVTIVRNDNEPVASIPVSESGNFGLEIDKTGDYTFLFEFAQSTLEIDKITLQ